MRRVCAPFVKHPGYVRRDLAVERDLFFCVGMNESESLGVKSLPWKDGEKRAALVTLHDTNLALNYCDRLLLINDSTIADTVNIREDDISVIQEKLRIIYGSISIQSFTNKNGDRQLVMVREPE